jgi:hypothetical protein
VLIGEQSWTAVKSVSNRRRIAEKRQRPIPGLSEGFAGPALRVRSARIIVLTTYAGDVPAVEAAFMRWRLLYVPPRLYA